MQFRFKNGVEVFILSHPDKNNIIWVFAKEPDGKQIKFVNGSQIDVENLPTILEKLRKHIIDEISFNEE